MRAEVLVVLLALLSVMRTSLSPEGAKLKRRKRIVNGKLSRSGEHPYMVSVQRKETQYGFPVYVHACGGALVEPDLVLTAAHCTLSGHDLYVAAGIKDIKDSIGNMVGVERIIIGNYNKTSKIHDIAVLKLKKKFVTVRSGHSPIDVIRIPSEEYRPKGHCTIAGWGRTTHGGLEPSILYSAQIPMFNHSKCKKLYKYKLLVRKTMLCAGGGNKDGCQGDSGGPLVCYDPNGKRVLAGISSWGIGCATPQVPGVYTDVVKYINFIDEAVKIIRKRKKEY